MAKSKSSSNEQENNLTLEIGIPQKGNIKVHSQIINDLSSGIYSSPSSCVKELVNNAYDADATLVTIRIKPIEDSITIIDNGSGMNALDFDNNFAWISKSNKRNEGQLSKYLNRPLIGKIGIGFIAVNEICEELEITSTKKGENIKFTATINFKDYYEKDTKVDGGIIKGAYNLINEEEDKDEHYTILRLLKLKDTVTTVLDDKQFFSELVRQKNKTFDTISFESMKDLLKFHFKKKLKSFSEDNSYLQFIIDLASYIPVEYIEGGPIEGYNDKIIQELVNQHKKLNFKVDLDGIYLKKPIFFPKQALSKVISFADELNVLNGVLKFKGYFFIQHGLITPRELNGVAIRIKNIPIAEQYGFDPTFIRYPNYMEQIFRNWISGEIYIEKGLEDAMNIDRKSFRVTHPQYLALQNYLHKLLKNKVFKVAHDNVYEVAKEQRTDIINKSNKENKKKILHTENIKFIRKGKSATPVQEKFTSIPLNIVQNSLKKTTVEINEDLAKKYKKKDWNLLEDIFLIFELAFKESKGDANELRKLFYQKINSWKDIN